MSPLVFTALLHTALLGQPTSILTPPPPLPEPKPAPAPLTLPQLEQAYAKKRTATLAYELGDAYRAEKRPVRAIEMYFTALAGPREEVALFKYNAEKAIRDLLPEVVTLEIVTTVEGASLSVDGQSLGPPRADRPVYLMPGEHTVLVEAPGRIAYKETISPVAGARVVIEPRLETPGEAKKEYRAPAPVVSAWGAAPARISAEDMKANLTPLGEEEPPRFYQRWWFWTALGVVAAAGGVAWALYPYEKDPYCGNTANCTEKVR